MGLLFDRKYSLEVGNPNKTDRQIYGVDSSLLRDPTSPSSIYTIEDYVEYIDGWSAKKPISDGALNVVSESSSDWRTSDKNGVIIDDLQITAKITSSAAGTSGGTTSTISVYNLSKSTRAALEYQGNYVILRAGYAQDTELRIVFVGQVETYETFKSGADVVTKLVCKDGAIPINSVRVSKKFSRTQTYADVVEYLVGVYGRNGIARGDIIYSGFQEILEDYTQLPSLIAGLDNYFLLTGYSVTGFLHQALATLCKQIGFVSYITNGKIFVHPRGYTSTVEQYEFSSKQMKSVRKAGGVTTNTSVSNGLRGVKIVTFLDGRLDIDKRIKITDGDHQGTYKIITKSHDLDYISGGWDTTITCTEVKT